MKKLLLLLLIPCTCFASEWTLLKQLTNAHGPSGFEDSVRSIIKKAWQPNLSKLSTDSMGNVIGHQNGQNKTRVLLLAHMDEVGFMVSRIDDNGLIYVQKLGGFVDNILPAQRFMILTPKGKVIGYSGIDSPHSVPRDKRALIPSINASNIFIDIGAKNKKDALEHFHVAPGQGVSFDSRFQILSQNRILAKALDDRLGLALLTDVMKAQNKPKNTVYYAATVQEEVGLRGAKVLYPSIKPDVTFNIEVGIASDFPLRIGQKSNPIYLGKGPTVFAYDHSMIPNQPLLRWVQKIAHTHHIPLQIELEDGYGEDGASIQESGKGSVVINITIPIRYAHQQAGIFDTSDYKNAIKLLTHLVAEFKPSVLV